MSIPENIVDVNTLEKEIFRQVCELGREALRAALESYDEELHCKRDKSVYRDKGLRKTTCKTVMGESEYRRHIYKVRGGEGRDKYVYLLDEAIGCSGNGFFSVTLMEEIARTCCGSSYREAAREVSALTGQTISHTAAWKIVQQLGEGVGSQERQAAALAAKCAGKGTLETKLLFEEQDGVWLKLQGKSRKEHGVSKEMKLAIAYDGAVKVGKKRWELTNKVACANFEGAARFQRRKEGVIAADYNVDMIEMRLLNGDGAAWIKSAAKYGEAHFQLDQFHRNKAIRTYVRDEDVRDEITELLYDKEIDLLLEYIATAAENADDEIERENLLTLLTYFTENKDGLIPCRRRGLRYPEPPEGKEYRRMGAMESNVFTILGNRMKGRRACWSINGANNMARLLCLKVTNKLSDTLRRLPSAVLPEKYADEALTSMTAAQAPKTNGKGYEPRRSGAFPSTGAYKTLRRIGAAASPLV